MNEFTIMINKKTGLLLLAVIFTLCTHAQPTQAIIDPEKQYKEAKELFVKEQYALAYPLLRNLKAEYPDNGISNHTYINDDINYYVTVCALKLEQEVAANDAKQYINLVANEPRRQMMSFHLAQYYFKKSDFSNAIDAYERAGIDNLSNTEIADAKFEKAYCYFNLKQFNEAKPLFDEVHQMTDSKYYIPANYYYGFICYYDRQYNEALKAFKLIEMQADYAGVVPYYIAEIFYFQGKKRKH
jgi:tetratricopeptide (TPR) repeat protein